MSAIKDAIIVCLALTIYFSICLLETVLGVMWTVLDFTIGTIIHCFRLVVWGKPPLAEKYIHFWIWWTTITQSDVKFKGPIRKYKGHKCTETQQKEWHVGNGFAWASTHCCVSGEPGAFIDDSNRVEITENEATL